ncbi:hypothetical protein FAZ19_23460 [Sphingobacterium alkalisoli]|uniref:Uncharacterized protein n=1 Tax=Sphingobacterium alkalisoli TaxID=1874115 RepID=A0A4U0GQ82_9SPHI|nr:hypothetical protein [Sphingobacterium alkalisoli]TJY59702.1 hypothetical protein FAZ19_23460 [Sphingobacterium alkalisoli]GGH32926.1 hypothetical protein GCM10011418_46770 [Sphingobacterium alkalisoli]
MNKLKLLYNRKKYPYVGDAYDPAVLWGEIILNVTCDNSLVKKIFKIEWDLRVVLDWLLINKNNILLASCALFQIESHISVAESVYRFYDIEDDLDEKMVDEMFEFRQSHCLRFGLRGVDIDEIYLGRNNNVHEISFYSEELSWKFEIDIMDFYREIELEFNH